MFLVFVQIFFAILYDFSVLFLRSVRISFNKKFSLDDPKNCHSTLSRAINFFATKTPYFNRTLNSVTPEGGATTKTLREALDCKEDRFYFKAKVKIVNIGPIGGRYFSERCRTCSKKIKRTKDGRKSCSTSSEVAQSLWRLTFYIGVADGTRVVRMASVLGKHGETILGTSTMALRDIYDSDTDLFDQITLNAIDKSFLMEFSSKKYHGIYSLIVNNVTEVEQ